MAEIWFECFEYYPHTQMWQYMLLCGVGGKPVAHLMQYHVTMGSCKSKMLPQKTPKGATTKIQVKRYKRDNIVSHIPVER